MMGIQSKIRFGFVAIGALLFLSGLISSLELNRFNRDIDRLLVGSREGVELSRQMLDALDEHSAALLQSLVGDENTVLYDSLLQKSARDFDRSLAQLHQTIQDPDRLEQVRQAGRYYYTMVGQRVGQKVGQREADILVGDRGDGGVEWFVEVYKTPYYNLTQAIKTFMVDSHGRTVEYATQIEHNAYRASMVGIIALAAGVLVLLVFYFMVKSYFVDPVLQITRSLKGYVESRVPFTVKVSTRDEIGVLKQAVMALIEALRKAKS